MMDESPAEIMHFIKSNAVKDAETNTTAELLHKLIDEKEYSEKSHVAEAFPFQKKVQKPLFAIGADTDASTIKRDASLIQTDKEITSPLRTKEKVQKSSSALRADIDRFLKGWQPNLIQGNEITSASSFEERRAHYTIPSPSDFKLLIRRRLSQEKIVFERECKKVGQVWANRGLPVDRETVCLAASKDAFDLKDLRESLPSTSASVNEEDVIEIDRRWEENSFMSFSSVHRKLSCMRGMLEHNLPTFTPKRYRYATFERLPASETISSACNSPKEAVQKGKELGSLMRAQTWARMKRVCRKQAREDSLMSKTAKVVSKMYEELSLPSSCVSTSEQPNFGSRFAQMSIDDKQEGKEEERQNSNAENHLPNPGLNLLPHIMTNYVSELEKSLERSGWDTSKSWITKFDAPDVLVPLNSPVKKEENADKSDSRTYVEKLLADMRQNTLKRLRDEKKLRRMNSFRNIHQFDDSSESEEPTSEEASRISVGKGVIVDTSGKMKKYSQLLRKMKESVKNVRVFQHPSPHCFVKSDKVVPD